MPRARSRREAYELRHFMRHRLLILWSLALLLLGVGCSPSLRQSVEHTEASLRALTPLGSSPEAVLDLLKKKGWSSPGHTTQSGFLKPQGPKSAVVGHSHIRASLGNYRAIPIGTTTCPPSGVSTKIADLSKSGPGRPPTISET